ncbi:MAG: radical SAM protein [Promethearchaeota archaeon]|nr:MAG: radical SAM protein [Candidatus Lokiarchaeota archaeon]
MGLKILLVNPNMMQSPPVIPIGLEYLATSLEKYEHDVVLLDLCFNPSPIEELRYTLMKDKFDIVGLSIRNIDSCIYFNNDFYLSEFKELIEEIKNYNIPIILGGSGFSAMPNEILEYFQADYGIIGPAENAFHKFLVLWKKNELKRNIINGWNYGIDTAALPIRGKEIDYQKYMDKDGIIGFTTHSGCQNQCPYCIEANTKVTLKKIANIIKEIEGLVNQGYTHFHLCDSEFNSDLKYSIEFCKQLAQKSLPMKWTLYMKPFPYNEQLFQLLKDSNAYLITLSVDSDKRIQKQNNYSQNDLAKIIDYSKKQGIDIAIDLLTGYPHEPIESTRNMLEFFRKTRPKTVGISFYFRIYSNTSLATLIKADKALQKRLSRPYTDKEDFLEPIFYNHLTREILEDLIAVDDLFRIAGLEAGVNYQL